VVIITKLSMRKERKDLHESIAAKGKLMFSDGQDKVGEGGGGGIHDVSPKQITVFLDTVSPAWICVLGWMAYDD